MGIQDLLIAWGRGRAINKPANGYPSQTPFARLMAQGTIRLAPLSDDEAQRVDTIISATKHSKPTHHKIIYLAYVNNLKDGEISNHIRFDGKRYSRSWVRQTRLAAEAYLEAKLDE